MIRVCSNSLKYVWQSAELVVSKRSVKCYRGLRWSSGVAGVKTKSNRSSLVYGVVAGIGLGTGLAFYKLKLDPNRAVLNPLEPGQIVLIDSLPPDIEISRKVRYAGNDSGLELILFQYATCPFCCKVRAFLDHHALSYDIVEVNPVLRHQLGWSSYKKVPILLVKTSQGKYMQLNDSSMIISALSSFMVDKKISLEEIVQFYPATLYKDDDGRVKSEIYNRYFLMYQGNIPDGETKESIEDVRKWRRWADDVLVHTLSPNVYRTTDEALDSFNWFSQVGEWDRLFPSWERYLVINVGAYAMWMIGKRLKKRHNLKDDVRESLYDACKRWTKLLRSRGAPFHGGRTPDLADLAVYGVLSSVEGCQAFSDLTKNTDILHWYSAVKRYITGHHRLA